MSRRRSEPVLDLISKLKEGSLSGRSLSVTDRRRCVDCLTTEGVSVPEIAQLLNRTERTIQRDRVWIRSQNALQVTPAFINETAGDLVREARACAERARRAARDKNASPSDRVEAERVCFEFFARTTELLQSLGFLPTASNGGVPDWHLLSQQAPDELLQEVDRLKAILSAVQARDAVRALPASSGPIEEPAAS